jgi:hypothetical protein
LKSHQTTDEEKEKFNQWFYTGKRIDKLGIIGDFAAKYIITNHGILTELTWSEAGKRILQEFYKIAGKESPEWIELLEKPNVMEETNDDTYFGLRGFFEQAIMEGHRKYTNDLNGMEVSFETKLSNCIEHRAVPYLFKLANKTINMSITDADPGMQIEKVFSLSILIQSQSLH